MDVVVCYILPRTARCYVTTPTGARRSDHSYVKCIIVRRCAAQQRRTVMVHMCLLIYVSVKIPALKSHLNRNCCLKIHVLCCCGGVLFVRHQNGVVSWSELKKAMYSPT